MMQKPGTPSSMPTKTTIFNWIKQIVPDANPKMKVEDLGDGVIYCKIINHYFPATISLNRLNTNPKNQYDYTLNLKLLQNALTVHKVAVPLDVGKIAKQKFLENWGLINALYRQLSSNSEESIVADDSKSVSYVGPKFTPKRSFETAFPTQQIHKLPEVQTFAKPIYAPPISQSIIHYQNSQTHPVQSMVCSQQILPETNRMVQTNSFSQNHNFNQSSTSHVNVNTNGTYSQPTMTQSAFGGFNFGMNSIVNGMNLASNNQGLSFSRPQTIINRETLAPQINKGIHFDQQTSNKCWSVGKLPTRESMGIYGINSQENSGKYSVNSHIFQNNYNAVIDRVKEILLKNSHDIEKIRQIKILLNIPLNQDMIKIEEEENVMINCTNTSKIVQQSALKEKETKQFENKIDAKESINGLKETIQVHENKSSKSLSNCDIKDKENQVSKSISNSGSCHEVRTAEKGSFASRIQQSSGKKIKNNFFGEGAVFRK